jgi:hypothetical protein
MEKNSLRLVAVLAVIGMVGCESPASGSADVDTSEYVRITVSVGHDEVAADVTHNRALTVLPSETFTYTADFTATDKGETVTGVAAAGKSITANLKPGTYTITVKGSSGGNNDVAIGTKTGVTVATGTTVAPVTVVMAPKTGEGVNDGILSYAITFPEGVTSATMTIHPTDSTGSDTTVDLKTKTNGTGTEGLAPGYYLVTVSLVKGSDHPGSVEVAHIYSGLTSTLTKTFTADYFSVE